MALQTSGPISLLDIQNEFGGSNPISISEYYSADSGVPTSGAISIGDFYGKSSYTSMSIVGTQNAFNTVASGSCVIVSGIIGVTISGGEPPYTYTFTRTSGFATPSSSTVNTSSTTGTLFVSQTVCPFGEVSGTYSITVSDSKAGSVNVVANVIYNFLNTGGSGFGGGLIS